MDLNDLAAGLREEFDARTAARERSMASSRNAIRACGNAIRAMHRYEVEDAARLLDEAQRCVDDGRAALGMFPDILHAGFVHDAEKELAEARITYALVTGAPFPDPEAVGVDTSAFAKGMAESIGELRRHI